MMLFHQAEAIWPQEVKFLESLEISKEDSVNILDLGCGSGEATLRLACLFPNAHVYGVDLVRVIIFLYNQR